MSIAEYEPAAASATLTGPRSTYKYKQLEGDRSIRILVLEPAASEDTPLRATLQEVALSDEPEFEAVSYAWGPPSFTIPLDLHDGILYITNSLASGLRRFRRADKPRTLWTDAVCINQFSIPEKSRQVAQMGSVFRNCTRCLIWLGIPEGSAVAAASFMKAYETLVATRERYGIEVNISGNIIGGWSAGIPDSGPVKDALQSIPVDFDWTGADEFYSAPWFKRRWCLQELVLSPQAEIYYGTHRISWNDFMIAAHIAWRSVVKTQAANLRLPYGFGQTRTLADARILFRDGLHLAQFLVLCSHFVCSDDRDYIYSLIGLRTSQDVEIWPDYNKTTAQVYKQSVRKMYLKDTLASIDLLSHAGLAQRLAPAVGRGHRNTVHEDLPAMEEIFKDLPSWVPDWRIKNPYVPVGKGVGPRRFVVASQNLPLVKSDDADSFSIAGQVLGRIISRKDLGTETDMYYNSHRDKLVEWKAWFDEQCTRCQPLPQSEDPLHIFLRTVMADQNTATTPNLMRKTLTMSELTVLWNLLVSSTYHDRGSIEKFETDGSAPRVAGTANSPTVNIHQYSDLFNFRLSLRQLLDDRQIFATELGLIGLGPSVAREGDMVVVLAGLHAPFIIRPSAEGTSFYLIGDCYAHGIMYGELHAALKVSKEWMMCKLI